MTKPRPNPRSKPSRNATHHRLYRARELAELLSVSPGSVYSWARSGRIPVIRASHRVFRFDADAVLAALEGGRK
jgi:excisionase family DNA binding protein